MAADEIQVQYERTEEIAKNIQSIADRFPTDRASQEMVSGCSGQIQISLFDVLSGTDSYGRMSRHLMIVTAGFLDMAAGAFRESDDSAADSY